jgi:hypothetical protein
MAEPDGVGDVEGVGLERVLAGPPGERLAALAASRGLAVAGGTAGEPGAGTALERVVTWDVEASGGTETAWVVLADGWLAARGRVLGFDPEPYWLTYALLTGDRYVTRRLLVEVEAPSGGRRLDLRRAGDGTWTANGEVVAAAAGALDCDLGLSPLTNTMPILRHRLHREPGEHGFAMAWVDVPALGVERSEQTYEHLRRTGVDGGAVVRFTSGGGSFVADLVLDRDGLLVDYPELARRRGT